MTVRIRKTALSVAVALLALGLSACDAKTPTQPEHPGPGGGGTSVSWVISVDAGDKTLATDETTILTISVRGVDDGAPPPDGAIVIVSTDLGAFNAAGTSTAAR